MRRSTLPEWWTGHRPAGSRIALLAGPGEWPAAARTRATVLPLDRHLGGRPAVVGTEVAVTGRLADLLPIPPTAVIVVPADADLAGAVGPAGDAACGLLGPEEADEAPVLTVGVAGAGAELCLYNLPREALPEALVESLAAARRAGVATAAGNCVLLVQRFAPARATAVATAGPDEAAPVLIRARWGLTEGDPAQGPADRFEVAADGTVLSERLAWKPTAKVTALGGTRTRSLAVPCRYQSSLSRTALPVLAELARHAAWVAGRPLSLDLAMFGDTPAVLRCRPVEGVL